MMNRSHEINDRDSDSGRRFAVVVGVNEFSDHATYGELHVCVKDAKAISKRLKSAGYNRVVTLCSDSSCKASRNNIWVELESAIDLTKGGT